MPSGTEDGTMAYLMDFATMDTIDSVAIANACCAFSGTVDTAYVAGLQVGDKYSIFVVEPGDITITFDDSTSNAIAQGTALNNAFAKQSETLDGIEDLDKYDEALKQLYEENKDNATAVFWLHRYVRNSDFNYSELDSILRAASPSYPSMRCFKPIIEKAQTKIKTEVGKPFIDFAGVDGNGKPMRLSDVVGKGKYALIDFWASWCPSCIEEIPTLKKIHEKWGDKLEMISVANRDTPEDNAQAVKQHGITWRVMRAAGEDKGEFCKLYGVPFIPYVIIVDPQGTIVARKLFGEQLVAKIDELLSV